MRGEANEPCDTRHQRGGVVVGVVGGVEQQHTMMCGFGAMMKEADTRNVVDVSSWKDQMGREGEGEGVLHEARPLFVQYNAKLTSMQKMERFSIYEEEIGVTLPLCNGLIDDAFTGLQFISISLTRRMTMPHAGAGRLSVGDDM